MDKQTAKFLDEVLGYLDCSDYDLELFLEVINECVGNKATKSKNLLENQRVGNLEKFAN